MTVAPTILRYVNHASILVQCGQEFVLTDPWYERPAFGSWLPVPPPAWHPVFLQTLARSAKCFIILVSHGHDDHLDDPVMQGAFNQFHANHHNHNVTGGQGPVAPGINDVQGPRPVDGAPASKPKKRAGWIGGWL